MTRSKFGKPYVAAIIERHDNHILIARLTTDEGVEPLWCFPRGRATDEETPEAAMRRITKDDLGMNVEIVVVRYRIHISETRIVISLQQMVPEPKGHRK